MGSPKHGEALEAPFVSDSAVPPVPAPLVMPSTPSGAEVALADSGTASGFNSRLTSPRPTSTAMQRMRFEAATRSGSTPSNARTTALVPRASHETAILTAMRRQMEALEEKLGGQMSRVQQQSDRLRDAAFSRVDQKMGSMEALQPKFDRRLAELSGNYKGLSDEMQAQIKRVDQLDSKLWEFRHQLEEEMRSKMAELEQNQQQASSAIRLASATSDDSIKRYNNRMVRLERLVEERLAYAEDTSQSLQNLHDRLSEVEGFRAQDLAICAVEAPKHVERSDPLEAAGDSAFLVALERRLADACQKIEMFQQESHELHIKVEAQEERLKSLRTRIETQEDHHRSLSDRVERVDPENRLKEVQGQLAEMSQGRIEHHERLELLHKRLESHEQVTDEISEVVRRLQVPSSVDAAEAHAAGLAAADSSASEALAVDVQECLRRLCDAELRLGDLADDMQSAKADVELGPRVAILVDQLKQVAPKVMDQELCVRDLHEKVGRLEVEKRLGDDRAASETALARIGKLEGEVDRIKEKVGA